MSASSFRLPCYRCKYYNRYHPYAVPDRQARCQTFDAVAYLMPPCVLNAFYLPSPAPPSPVSPVSSSGIGGSVSDVVHSAAPASVEEVAPSVEHESTPATSGAAISFTGATHNSHNILGITFENTDEPASDQSTSSVAQFDFYSDDSQSETGVSSLPPSPTMNVSPLNTSVPLPPLAGLANLRNFSLALPGQETASPLDLAGLGEVLNELERPDGEEGALVRSDSALILDFSLAMQRLSHPYDV